MKPAYILLIVAIAAFPSAAVSQIPELTSPEEHAILDNGCVNQTDKQTWEFSWSPVDGTRRYQIFVQRLGAQFPVLNTAVDGTSYSFSRIGYVAPQNADGWTWRVRALVNGKWGKWSSVRSFSVEPVDSDCQ